MRKYLETLPTKSHHEKKRFALLVSGGVTLSIFALWTLVNFGSGAVVAQADKTRVSKEVGPVESFSANVKEAFQSIRDTFTELNDYVR